MIWGGFYTKLINGSDPHDTYEVSVKVHSKSFANHSPVTVEVYEHGVKSFRAEMYRHKVIVWDNKTKLQSSDIIKSLRDKSFEVLRESLLNLSPDSWSNYMTGHVKLWTPIGIKNLNDYIISLNDYNGMSREDIAAHIEDLMGAATPRIPINPLSWILEDAPVEEEYRLNVDNLKAQSITASKIVGPNSTLMAADGDSFISAEFSIEGSVKPLTELHPSIKVPDNATSASMEYDHKTMTDKYKFYDHEGKELDCLVVDKLVMDGLSLLNDEDAP